MLVFTWVVWMCDRGLLLLSKSYDLMIGCVRKRTHYNYLNKFGRVFPFIYVYIYISIYLSIYTLYFTINPCAV